MKYPVATQPISISSGYKSNSPIPVLCGHSHFHCVAICGQSFMCIPWRYAPGSTLCFTLGHGDLCTGYDPACPGNPKTQQPASSPCHGGIPPACWPSEPSSPVAKSGHDNRTHPCTHNSRFGQAQAGHFFSFQATPPSHPSVSRPHAPPIPQCPGHMPFPSLSAQATPLTTDTRSHLHSHHGMAHPRGRS